MISKSLKKGTFNHLTTVAIYATIKEMTGTSKPNRVSDKRMGPQSSETSTAALIKIKQFPQMLQMNFG